MVQESLDAGVDLVAFSGDKLLGGPQAGVILGRATFIDQLRRHPMARAVRPDKVILAALSATVHAYLAGDAEQTLPIWRMIAQSPSQIEARAEHVRLQAASHGLDLQLVPGESTVGGGSLPGETLPSTLLVLPRAITAQSLRELVPPIVARTQAGRTVIDLRTVAEEEESALLSGLITVAKRPPRGRD